MAQAEKTAVLAHTMGSANVNKVCCQFSFPSPEVASQNSYLHFRMKSIQESIQEQNGETVCIVNNTLIIASVAVSIAVFWPNWLKSVLGQAKTSLAQHPPDTMHCQSGFNTLSSRYENDESSLAGQQAAMLAVKKRISLFFDRFSQIFMSILLSK